MAERPILFSGPMVRALLAGTKTQTRRAVANVDADGTVWRSRHRLSGVRPFTDAPPSILEWCPYGRPGDRLWVRETWTPCGQLPTDGALYRADFPEGPLSIKFKPSIHMPRWANRIQLEITDVRVERLQDINDADSLSEGVDRTNTSIPGYAKERFRCLWESINGAESWNANPWVWAVSFKRIDQEPTNG